MMSGKRRAQEGQRVSFVGAAGKAQWGKNENMLDWST